MIKTISILIFALLLSCSSNSNEKGKMQDKSKDYFVIDTLLSDYQTKLKLSQAHFKKGIDNKMMIQITSVPNDKILIYTKTSEATIKLIKDKSGYLVLPKTTADSVTINVNINKDGKMILIGKIKFKIE